MSKENISIIPESGYWLVTRENDPTPIGAFDTKAEAIRFGSDKARRDGVLLFVREPDGRSGSHVIVQPLA